MGSPETAAIIDSGLGMPDSGSLAVEPKRFAPPPPEPVLYAAARAGDVRLAVVFGGQGAAWFGELREMHAAHPSVRTLVRACTDRLRASAADPRLGALATPARGFDLARWIEQPETTPPADVLSSSLVSQAGIFITQVARLVAMGERGFDYEALLSLAKVATGHSQGIMTALLFAEGHGFAGLVRRTAEFASYFFWQGYRMQEAFVLAATPPAVREAAEKAGIGEPSPMAAIGGLTRELLEESLARFHAANPQLPAIDISLDNTYVRKVISGPPASLVAFAQALTAAQVREKEAFAKGRLGRRPIDFKWEFIAASAPFHSRYMEHGHRTLPADVTREGIRFSASALKLPVLAYDGRDLRNEGSDDVLLASLVRMQHVESVHWAEVCAAMRRSHPEGITHVLDYGPGDAVAKLTAVNCRGFGVHVFPLVTEAGRREAMPITREELPRALDYRRFAPRLRREVTGEVVIDNAFRRFTGRAPIFLPGMTPTTVEAPIVAAAANAGFVSELAGGGQPTERHFRLRAKELSRLLQPGAAYTLNLLFLDPYLWNLHWKNERLVPRLRAEGAAIEGITVSAGIPELAEAREVIETSRAHGLKIVSFKPGTARQIQQVLEIARAFPDFTLGMQIEGGKAGGHHSWEDLRELVRTHYHQIREQQNIVLSVGGGIRNEEDAFAWLSGRWSEQLGLAPMPVDAVFVGTICMAAAEAQTSPQVKALLVQTAGTNDWVTSGSSKGGVTSGKSQLDADIHYVDNTAARVGRMLDEVAGKPEAALARKAEIVAALGKTAKPYFGDLTAMSPAQVLRRMVELMVIGRGTEYEDGRWPDPSYRQRVHDMAQRLEERLAEKAGPSVVRGLADLDDPTAFVARFVAAYPQAETTLVSQADADYFVQRICARPGKPVNFVPAIDGDVRRWYKSDALWQAHDDRYDADAVLVIPGPEAVQGITRANEPIGELLHRFVKHAITRLEAEGQQPEPARDAIDRSNLARAARMAGLVVEPATESGVITATATAEAAKAKPAGTLAWLEALDPVLLAPLAAATGVLRDSTVVPNALPRLLRSEVGDSWKATTDAEGRLTSLVVKRASGHAIELAFSRVGGVGRCDVTLVHALPVSHSGEAPEVRVTLAFEHALAHPARFPREVTPERAQHLGEFYRATMLGEGAMPLAGDEVRAAFTVGREFIREYAVAAGDASAAHVGGRGGTLTLPLNAAFSAAFGAIFRATFIPDVAWDPARLVHLENSVRCFGPALHEGEALDVAARLVAWEPGKGGVRIRTEALLRSGALVRAQIDSTFFVQGETSTYAFRSEHRTYRLPANDPALLDLLQEKPWLHLEPGAKLDPAKAHEIELTLRTTTHDGVVTAEVSGKVRPGAGRSVAMIAHSETGRDATETEPVRWLAKFAPVRGTSVALPQPSPMHVERAIAPRNLSDFARASRDLNPLHRDPHVAALAGFDQPIVHGQWTAARAVAAAVAGFAGTDGERVRAIDVSFTDVVMPGDELELRTRHTGMRGGDLLVDMEARVKGSEEEGRLALRGQVQIALPHTAYVFPGQGVQSTGMGMDGYARSAAARRVWDEADAYCRDTLGFSLLTVVRENPHEMRVGQDLLRHEQGVLFLTQFTQVAMAVLAAAQVAELREAGCFEEDAPFCGHSVGEYSAIGAITDMLPLWALVECVYHRGLTMQTYVPRDSHGRSPYRMAVVRPNVVKMSEPELIALVTQVSQETGLLCEVVNFNIRGRQYSVVGDVPALDALRAKLRAREAPGSKSPYIEVPGIDVPFHSKALRDGVPAFREKLEAYTPRDLDVTPLIDRYIPNLVARPFSLSRSYLDETIACTDSEVLLQMRARWDAEGKAPPELGRTLFIEGLAYQFASPVRWIETQDVLLGRDRFGVQRVIEIGVASAPTQANMFKATLATDPSRLDPAAIYNIEIDRKAVFHLYDAETEASAPAQTVTAPAAPTPSAAAPAPVAAPSRSAGPIADAPLSLRDSLITVLALKARVRADEVRADETIEALCGGNSSRRNQVLADIGAEFGIGAIDGGHELPLTKLVEALEKATGGKYRTQGAYLRAQIAAALKPAGLSTKDVLSLCAAKGLPEGRSLALLNRLALWTRTGDSTRNGAISPLAPPKPGDRGAAAGWLEAAVAKYAQDEGLQLGGSASAGGGATVDAAALDKLLARYFGVGGAFLESLRFAEAALGRDVWAELEVRAAEGAEDGERLGRYDAEHGAAYEKAIRPAFTSDKAMVFSGSWAWSRRDALALYHDLRAGKANPEHVESTLARIARAADHAAAKTAAYLHRRAEREGDAQTAAVFARLAAAIAPQKHPHAASEAIPLRPMVEVRPDGTLHDFEVPRGGAPTAPSLAEELLAHEHARLRVHSATGPDVEQAQQAYRSSLLALARGEASFAGRTALVTGASDRSIALELLKLLLTGGARVVVTTSQHTPERVRFYRRIFQRYGARGAELAVVPFNQGSRQDIQRLVSWLVSGEKTTVGGTQRTVKEPWLIDLLVPFGAIGEEGTLADISDRSMATLRVLLYGVEALVGECAQAFSRMHMREARTHVVLPLSPNHGQFGNDGMYGETKAALEAMLNRWNSEQSAWGQHASVVGARIGWVRGTGLMNVNNAIAPGLEAQAGVRTFSTAEMGLLLGACCADGVRELAKRQPLVADFTGGMDAVRDLSKVARSLRSDLANRMARAKRLQQLRSEEAEAFGKKQEPVRTVMPAPRYGSYFAFPALPSKARRQHLSALRHLDLSRLTVIVGLGEAGPWGSSRSRWSMEAAGELSLEACVELAWMTGRIRFERHRNHVGWVDAKSGDPVREQEVKTRYEAELLADAGIRIIDPKAQNGFDPQKLTVWGDVILEKDLVFPVPSQADGDAYLKAAGDGARLIFDPAKDGWFVVRRKGSVVKVARAARLNRYVAGQIPTGWDAVRYGIPKDMVEQVDRTTLFNLVATVEAFLSAGMEPEELYEYLHPADVGNTQGAGIGGMQKLKRLYLDHVLDRPRQGDALQETLINVTAAWIVQSLIGSYGPMVHPVGACATAAVSIEEATDKILGGKAAFVVAGGYDDYGEEGAIGFSDMAATCDSDDMIARGIPPREMSRPNDRRRRGFVEAQGGGTVLVARADLAVKMGLPIYAAVALARSYGDGIHRSIPAPGPGVMAVAAERRPHEGELSGAQFSDLSRRTAEWEAFLAKAPELRRALGDEATEALLQSERRRRFHDFHAGDDRVSPLRRALATFGLVPDDVVAAWKHDTSTDANDPNENRAYDRIMRWLGRDPGNPLVVVSQKALTGHSKGGAAAWQVAGLCQAMANGVIPGNPNLDDPDSVMRAYETVAFTDRAIHLAPNTFEAGMATSLGFGHVGGIICLVHPDRVLAALDDEAFETYAAKRAVRERDRLHQELAILEGTRPGVRLRTEKKFVVPAGDAYAGLEPEQAVLLDASSRRLEHGGPIVAGGHASSAREARRA